MRLRLETPMKLVLATVAAAGGLLLGAPAALADCNADAASAAAEATVTYVGDSWGPVPIWRVSLPAYNATVDVAADAAADAVANAMPAITGAVCQAEALAAPPAVAAPAGSAASQTADPTVADPTVVAEASTLAQTSTVTYVGDDWGPLPIWRVSVPSLNETVDVAADSASDALLGVVGSLTVTLTSNPLAPVNPAGTEGVQVGGLAVVASMTEDDGTVVTYNAMTGQFQVTATDGTVRYLEIRAF